MRCAFLATLSIAILASLAVATPTPSSLPLRRNVTQPRSSVSLSHSASTSSSIISRADRRIILHDTFSQLDGPTLFLSDDFLIRPGKRYVAAASASTGIRAITLWLRDNYPDRILYRSGSESDGDSQGSAQDSDSGDDWVEGPALHPLGPIRPGFRSNERNVMMKFDMPRQADFVYGDSGLVGHYTMTFDQPGAWGSLVVFEEDFVPVTDQSAHGR